MQNINNNEVSGDKEISRKDIEKAMLREEKQRVKDNIDDKMLTVEAEIMLKESKMQGDKQQELLGVLEKYGLSKVEAMKALLELSRIIKDVED